MKIEKGLRIVTIALSLAAGSTGCYSWKAVEPAALGIQPSPEKVRLTTRSRSHLVVRHPRIEHDSIVGISADTAVAVHFDRVLRVEKRGFSSSNTIGLVFFTVGGTILLAGTVALIGCAFAGGCGM